MAFDYSGFSILHGEDDAADTRVMQKILERINFNGEYQRLALGHEIVEWVSDSTKPLPGLILLDINLPGVSGREILDHLRGDERTMTVPVLMMTGSSSLRDYRECIQLGVNGYIQKTHDLQAYQDVCHHFIEGWARLAAQRFF